MSRFVSRSWCAYSPIRSTVNSTRFLSVLPITSSPLTRFYRRFGSISPAAPTPIPSSSSTSSSSSSPVSGQFDPSSKEGDLDLFAFSNANLKSFGSNSVPRAMPLTELNQRGKEMSGEDYTMEADTDEMSVSSSTPVLDPIDSNLTASPLSNEEIVFEEMRLADILRQKERYGSTIYSVKSTDRIVSATELMAHMNIGAVLVRDAKNPNTFSGIVSTRDFVKKIQEKNLHPTTSPVSEFMTPSPVFAYADETAITCLYLMSKHNFRHLPVRERRKGASTTAAVGGKEAEEKTVGLVSIGDLVRVMLKQYRQSNKYLREYIDGQYPH